MGCFAICGAVSQTSDISYVANFERDACHMPYMCCTDWPCSSGGCLRQVMEQWSNCHSCCHKLLLHSYLHSASCSAPSSCACVLVAVDVTTDYVGVPFLLSWLAIILHWVHIQVLYPGNVLSTMACQQFFVCSLHSENKLSAGLSHQMITATAQQYQIGVSSRSSHRRTPAANSLLTE